MNKQVQARVWVLTLLVIVALGVGVLAGYSAGSWVPGCEDISRWYLQTFDEGFRVPDKWHSVRGNPACFGQAAGEMVADLERCGALQGN